MNNDKLANKFTNSCWIIITRGSSIRSFSINITFSAMEIDGLLLLGFMLKLEIITLFKMPLKM